MDFQSAQQAHQRGDLATAEVGYRAVLAHQPDHGDAAHLLGLICLGTNRSDEGLALLRRSLVHQPERVDWLINLTEAARRAGLLEEALQTGQRAVALGPQAPDAYVNYGHALRDTGRIEDAIAAFRRAVQLRPNLVKAHLQLGQLLRQEGKSPVAEKHFQTAVQLQPDSGDGWLGLAATHLELGETAAALQDLERARALQPDREELDRLMGDALTRQGRTAEAAVAYARHGQRHREDWWQTFRRELLCQPIPPSEDAVDEERQRILAVLDRYRGEQRTLPLAQLHQLAIEPPMALTYHGRDERSMKAAFASFFESLIEPLPARQRPRNARPVVGVFVTSGHEGVYDRCLGPLMTQLAQRGQVDVRLVSTRAGLNVLRHLRPDFPGTYLEVPVALDDAARTIQAAGVDVLHYWEIGTDSTNYFLPFLKPAPIQTGTWGWPSTSGTTRVEGFVSSQWLEPEDGANHYAETLFALKSLPTLYTMPPAPKRTVRAALPGVPPDAHLYVCVQNLRKLQPSFDAVLADLLRHDPRGWLLCLADEQPTITDLFRQRLQRGMPDVLPRVRCIKRLPREQYLELVSAADVIVDSFHYGGGANTAADALATATPVVTWTGPYHRGRWQTAVNQLIGLDELNAATAEEFVQKAVQTANDTDSRQHLAHQIQTHRDRFFLNHLTVLEHEALFLELAARDC